MEIDLNDDQIPDTVIFHRRKLWFFHGTKNGPQFSEPSAIIKSAEDSGYDHVHAYVDPNRFQSMDKPYQNFPPFSLTRLLTTVFDPKPGQRVATPSHIPRKQPPDPT